jgi:hypothetical protein
MTAAVSADTPYGAGISAMACSTEVRLASAIRWPSSSAVQNAASVRGCPAAHCLVTT